MSKKARPLFAITFRRARPLPGSRETPATLGGLAPGASSAEDANDLTIELLEERLAPGYPARYAKKTAGWGC
jgi:hypothetical protein